MNYPIYINLHCAISSSWTSITFQRYFGFQNKPSQVPMKLKITLEPPVDPQPHHIARAEVVQREGGHATGRHVFGQDAGSQLAMGGKQLDLYQFYIIGFNLKVTTRLIQFSPTMNLEEFRNIFSMGMCEPFMRVDNPGWLSLARPWPLSNFEFWTLWQDCHDNRKLHWEQILLSDGSPQ